MLIRNIILFILVSFLSFQCYTTKIENYPAKTGAIIGCVYGETGGLTHANVIILDHNEPWSGVQTGKGGQFLMLDVPPGIYRVRGSKIQYHWQEVFNVRVAPDSLSFVSFRMQDVVLQMMPFPPFPWTEDENTLVDLREFVRAGKIFALECW